MKREDSLFGEKLAIRPPSFASCASGEIGDKAVIHCLGFYMYSGARRADLVVEEIAGGDYIGDEIRFRKDAGKTSIHSHSITVTLDSLIRKSKR